MSMLKDEMNEHDYFDDYVENDVDKDANSHTNNIINYILFDKSYDIICFFEELKERFALNPDFLCYCNSVILSKFITNNILTIKKIPTLNRSDVISFESFKCIFKNELEISYNVLYDFLKTICKKYNVCHEKFHVQWYYFCFRNSDIPIFV